MSKIIKDNLEYIKKISDLEGTLSEKDWEKRREEIRLAQKAMDIINYLLGVEDDIFNDAPF